MNVQGYYRAENVPNNDFCVKDRDIVVNCSGFQIMNKNTCAHSVRKDFYMIYLTKGVFNLSLKNHPMVVSEGQMIIIEPNNEFEYQAVTEEIQYFWLHTTGYDIKRMLNAHNITTNTALTINPSRSHFILKIFSDIFSSLRQHDNFFEAETALLFRQLCIQICRALQTSSVKTDVRITESLKFIHNNFSKQLCLYDLATRECMSVSAYRSKFKEITEKPPIEYITMVRIQNACMLLTTTNLLIDEISELSGYPDHQYFYRIFKKHMNMPPAKYRKTFMN